MPVPVSVFGGEYSVDEGLRLEAGLWALSAVDLRGGAAFTGGISTKSSSTDEAGEGAPGVEASGGLGISLTILKEVMVDVTEC